MFSGFGISADGTNFALALRGGLICGPMSRPFLASRPRAQNRFSIQTRTKTVTVASYWQLPERLYDDPEELTGWARAALAAAKRAALKKRPKRKKVVKKKSTKTKKRAH